MTDGVRLREYAEDHGLDENVLALLIESGVLPYLARSGRSYRVDPQLPLTRERVETAAEEMYTRALERLGKLVIRMHVQLQRVLNEIEEQELAPHGNHPLGDSLSSLEAGHRTLLSGGESSDLWMAAAEVKQWHKALRDAHAGGAVEGEVQEIRQRMLGRAAMQTGKSAPPAQAAPRPIAHDLPPEVDQLPTSARRLIVDLSESLVRFYREGRD
ncbi:hypothetical protein E4P34_06360 [Kocuria rhizophila]|uniref:MerR family transcriptional regulator n=1 Tax=Kocuria rhizophila TaxID=72000 RepID=A0AAX2SFY5_KOCRH|nr:hypothetical protein [Kocuria rhizophila]MCT1958629.1 hypothetical protein [Kocuria rhizophila]MCT2074561.1 hypothetical protein [Kocuria rhizophila]TFI02584.1 hypothetical protein E4P33_03030 [Kocuria rhizophila]TFI07888.1 hypothetical protein E4P34_06360 [Kocuria rhizophila]